MGTVPIKNRKKKGIIGTVPINVKKRIVLKVSGEAFGTREQPLQEEKIAYLAEEISKVKNAEFIVVPGGGNILRGKDLKSQNFCKVEADYLGMLSTIYNAVTLKNKLAKIGIRSIVFSQLRVEKITDPYTPRDCLKKLNDGFLSIVAGGTGNPFVTTDTAAALRALELNAGIIIKATKVDGVYSDDPQVNKNAEFFPRLTYQQAIEKNLKVCDQTALSLLKDSDVKFMVLNIFKKNNIKKAAAGKCPGTVIRNRM